MKPLEGTQRSKDSTTKNLMRCAEYGLDLVGLRELSYKGVEVLKGGSRESNYEMVDHRAPGWLSG